MADEKKGGGGWVDPYRAYNFKLMIQGQTLGHFTRCSGMGAKVTAIRYRAGGTGQVVHRLPGPVEYGDITLKYGLTDSKVLWDWFMTAVAGAVERKNVSIVLLDADGAREVMRWDLVNAWPSEWQGAPLDALAREVAIESVTLVYEMLGRA
ncbi:MAG: phage tail protein [Myxococcales bacterium]|nr:phage tail protein [Myxococcales bacterium]